MPCLIALATFERGVGQLSSDPHFDEGSESNTSLQCGTRRSPCSTDRHSQCGRESGMQCSIRFNPKPCPFLNLAHLSSILSKTRTDSSKTRLVAAGAPSASKLGTPLSKASLPSDSRPINRDPHAALPACHPNPALDKRKRFGCGVVPWREPRLPLSQ